jgi:hypothetical protein
MGNLMSLTEKHVDPKGLNISALPDENKVKNYFFQDDYKNLSLLSKLPKVSDQDKLTLFYPGCGADILFPLKYIEKLFDLKEASLIFNDLDSNLGLIKTILDDINIHFSQNGNKIKFYWKNILVNLEFVQGNIFKLLPNLPDFDIYFERAFRIMKMYHLGYEDLVYQKLNKNGILISDSGFSNLALKRIDISMELSSYKEMILGIKLS